MLLLRNELEKESKIYPGIVVNDLPPEDAATIDDLRYKKIKTGLDQLRKQFIEQYNNASAKKESIVKEISATENLTFLRDNYTNDVLNDLVRDKTNFDWIIASNYQFVQRYEPVYMDAAPTSFVRAQFFTSRKKVFSNYYSTWIVNFAVIWTMSLLLVIALYYNWLRKLLRGTGNVFERMKFLFAKKS
jgi:hypothetical protein